MAKTLQFRRGTTGELASITPANGEILIDTTLNTIKIGNNTVAGGKVINGLAGSSYIYVTGNGASSTVNGEELLAAYNLAKTMTPFGNGLNNQNRIAIVIAPGRYYVGFSPNGRLDIDADYVDIISLTGERDVFIEEEINITANDVLIRGLYSTYDIYVDSNLSNLRMENCLAFNLAKGNATGDNDVNISGTFIDCEATNAGFAADIGGMASGTFINCKAYNGFGNYDGDATGVFTNCTTLDRGFAFSDNNIGYGIASGTFTNCTAGWSNSFGGGLGGTSYVYVAGDKSSFELNGEELLAAYALAKAMTPFGNAKDVYNRVQVVVAPGTYYFPNDDFNIDSNYVDVVSLTGNRDVVLDFINVTSVATDVYLKGLDLGTNPFTIYGNQPNLKIENCTGGDYSFSGDTQSTSGTFTNCTAGDYSFGGRDNAGDIGYGYIEDGAVCINCTAGDYSFGGNQLYMGGTADGTFINCTAGDYSFGGTGFTNGTFTDCVAGQGSFGGDGNVVGTYTGCTAGDYSFGGIYLSSVSGTFNNCIAGNNSFGEATATVSGTFNNCTAGNNSFGQNGGSTVSGTFNNCTSGSYSFGADSATVSGTFKNCYAGESSFGASSATVTSTAFFSNCRVDNGLGFNFGGGVSGTFAGRASHCYSSGSFSFGQGGLTGRLEYCVLVNASLPVVTSPGRTFLCVDSLGINNQ